jgi:hypothetical protein
LNEPTLNESASILALLTLEVLQTLVAEEDLKRRLQARDRVGTAVVLVYRKLQTQVVVFFAFFENVATSFRI